MQSNIHHKCWIFSDTDSEAGRAQDAYLDVNTSNNAQQSSEDESSTYEDVEGSHPNKEGGHFETDEGSHSTIDSPSSDEEQTGEGQTIRICIVDPLESQSETGKQKPSIVFMGVQLGKERFHFFYSFAFLLT